MTTIKNEILPKVSYVVNFERHSSTLTMRGSDLVITSPSGEEAILPFAGDLMLSSSAFAVQFKDGVISSKELTGLIKFSEEDEYESRLYGMVEEEDDVSNAKEEESEEDEEAKESKEESESEAEKEQGELSPEGETTEETNPNEKQNLYEDPPVPENSTISDILDSVKPTIIINPKPSSSGSSDSDSDASTNNPPLPDEEVNVASVTIRLNSSSDTGLSNDPTRGDTYVQGILKADDDPNAGKEIGSLTDMIVAGEATEKARDVLNAENVVDEGENPEDSENPENPEEEIKDREFGFEGEAPYGSDVTLLLVCEFERFVDGEWEKVVVSAPSESSDASEGDGGSGEAEEKETDVVEYLFDTIKSDENGTWSLNWTDIVEELVAKGIIPETSPEDLRLESGSLYNVVVMIEAENAAPAVATLTGLVDSTEPNPTNVQLGNKADNGLETDLNITNEKAVIIEGKANPGDYVRLYFIDPETNEKHYLYDEITYDQETKQWVESPAWVVADSSGMWAVRPNATTTDSDSSLDNGEFKDGDYEIFMEIVTQCGIVLDTGPDLDGKDSESGDSSSDNDGSDDKFSSIVVTIDTKAPDGPGISFLDDALPEEPSPEAFASPAFAMMNASSPVAMVEGDVENSEDSEDDFESQLPDDHIPLPTTTPILSGTTEIHSKVVLDFTWTPHPDLYIIDPEGTEAAPKEFSVEILFTPTYDENGMVVSVEDSFGTVYTGDQISQDANGNFTVDWLIDFDLLELPDYHDGGLRQGSYEFKAHVEDLAGNTSTTQEETLYISQGVAEDTAGDVEIVVELTHDTGHYESTVDKETLAKTNEPELSLKGTAPARTTLDVTIKGQYVYSETGNPVEIEITLRDVQVGNNGEWTVSWEEIEAAVLKLYNEANPDRPLGSIDALEGFPFTASAVLVVGGVEYVSNELIFAVNTELPEPPDHVSLSMDSDMGSDLSDGVTNVRLPYFTVEGDAGDYVRVYYMNENGERVYVNDEWTEIKESGRATIETMQNELEYPGGLEGDYTFYVEIESEFGVESDPNLPPLSFDVTVDIDPPTFNEDWFWFSSPRDPSDIINHEWVDRPADEKVTTMTTPTMTALAELGATVHIDIEKTVDTGEVYSYLLRATIDTEITLAEDARDPSLGDQIGVTFYDSFGTSQKLYFSIKDFYKDVDGDGVKELEFTADFATWFGSGNIGKGDFVVTVQVADKAGNLSEETCTIEFTVDISPEPPYEIRLFPKINSGFNSDMILSSEEDLSKEDNTTNSLVPDFEIVTSTGSFENDAFVEVRVQFQSDADRIAGIDPQYLFLNDSNIATIFDSSQFDDGLGYMLVNDPETGYTSMFFKVGGEYIDEPMTLNLSDVLVLFEDVLGSGKLILDMRGNQAGVNSNWYSQEYGDKESMEYEIDITPPEMVNQFEFVGITGTGETVFGQHINDDGKNAITVGQYDDVLKVTGSLPATEGEYLEFDNSGELVDPPRVLVVIENAEGENVTFTNPETGDVIDTGDFLLNLNSEDGEFPAELKYRDGEYIFEVLVTPGDIGYDDLANYKLTNGTYTIKIIVQDSAGNYAEENIEISSTEIKVVSYAAVPTWEIVSDFDTGINLEDGITYYNSVDNPPMIEVTGELGAQIFVEVFGYNKEGELVPVGFKYVGEIVDYESSGVGVLEVPLTDFIDDSCLGVGDIYEDAVSESVGEIILDGDYIINIRSALYTGTGDFEKNKNLIEEIEKAFFNAGDSSIAPKVDDVILSVPSLEEEYTVTVETDLGGEDEVSSEINADDSFQDTAPEDVFIEGQEVDKESFETDRITSSKSIVYSGTGLIDFAGKYVAMTFVPTEPSKGDPVIFYGLIDEEGNWSVNAGDLEDGYYTIKSLVTTASGIVIENATIVNPLDEEGNPLETNVLIDRTEIEDRMTIYCGNRYRHLDKGAGGDLGDFDGNGNNFRFSGTMEKGAIVKATVIFNGKEYVSYLDLRTPYADTPNEYGEKIGATFYFPDPKLFPELYKDGKILEGNYSVELEYEDMAGNDYDLSFDSLVHRVNPDIIPDKTHLENDYVEYGSVYPNDSTNKTKVFVLTDTSTKTLTVKGAFTPEEPDDITPPSYYYRVYKLGDPNKDGTQTYYKFGGDLKPYINPDGTFSIDLKLPDIDTDGYYYIEVGTTDQCANVSEFDFFLKFDTKIEFDLELMTQSESAEIFEETGELMVGDTGTSGDNLTNQESPWFSITGERDLTYEAQLWVVDEYGNPTEQVGVYNGTTKACENPDARYEGAYYHLYGYDHFQFNAMDGSGTLVLEDGQKYTIIFPDGVIKDAAGNEEEYSACNPSSGGYLTVDLTPPSVHEYSSFLGDRENSEGDEEIPQGDVDYKGDDYKFSHIESSEIFFRGTAEAGSVVKIEWLNPATGQYVTVTSGVKVGEDGTWIYPKSGYLPDSSNSLKNLGMLAQNSYNTFKITNLDQAGNIAQDDTNPNSALTETEYYYLYNVTPMGEPKVEFSGDDGLESEDGHIKDINNATIKVTTTPNTAVIFTIVAYDMFGNVIGEITSELSGVSDINGATLNFNLASLVDSIPPSDITGPIHYDVTITTDNGLYQKTEEVDYYYFNDTSAEGIYQVSPELGVSEEIAFVKYNLNDPELSKDTCITFEDTFGFSSSMKLPPHFAPYTEKGEVIEEQATLEALRDVYDDIYVSFSFEGEGEFFRYEVPIADLLFAKGDPATLLLGENGLPLIDAEGNFTFNITSEEILDHLGIDFLENGQYTIKVGLGDIYGNGSNLSDMPELEYTLFYQQGITLEPDLSLKAHDRFQSDDDTVKDPEVDSDWKTNDTSPTFDLDVKFCKTVMVEIVDSEGNVVSSVSQDFGFTESTTIVSFSPSPELTEGEYTVRVTTTNWGGESHTYTVEDPITEERKILDVNTEIDASISDIVMSPADGEGYVDTAVIGSTQITGNISGFKDADIKFDEDGNAIIPDGLATELFVFVKVEGEETEVPMAMAMPMLMEELGIDVEGVDAPDGYTLLTGFSLADLLKPGLEGDNIDADGNFVITLPGSLLEAFQGQNITIIFSLRDIYGNISGPGSFNDDFATSDGVNIGDDGSVGFVIDVAHPEVTVLDLDSSSDPLVNNWTNLTVTEEDGTVTSGVLVITFSSNKVLLESGSVNVSINGSALEYNADNLEKTLIYDEETNTYEYTYTIDLGGSITSSGSYSIDVSVTDEHGRVSASKQKNFYVDLDVPMINDFGDNVLNINTSSDLFINNDSINEGASFGQVVSTNDSNEEEVRYFMNSGKILDLSGTIVNSSDEYESMEHLTLYIYNNDGTEPILVLSTKDEDSLIKFNSRTGEWEVRLDFTELGLSEEEGSNIVIKATVSDKVGNETPLSDSANIEVSYDFTAPVITDVVFDDTDENSLIESTLADGELVLRDHYTCYSKVDVFAEDAEVNLDFNIRDNVVVEGEDTVPFLLVIEYNGKTLPPIQITNIEGNTTFATINIAEYLREIINGEGSYDFSITIYDQYKNASTPIDFTFVYDETEPTIIKADDNVSFVSDVDEVYNQESINESTVGAGSIIMSGKLLTAESGTVFITIKDAEGNPIGDPIEVTLNKESEWQHEFDISGLAEGSYSVEYFIRDYAGNETSVNDLASFDIDRTPPDRPIANLADISSVESPFVDRFYFDEKSIASGDIHLTGNGIHGDKVIITIGENTVEVYVDSFGNWTSPDLSAWLNEGTNTFLVTAVDPYGNASDTTTLNVYRDSEPPAAPVLRLEDQIGDGFETATETPELTITFEKECQVTIYIFDENGNRTALTSQWLESGQYVYELSDLVENGDSFAYEVEIMDKGGNITSSGKVTIGIPDYSGQDFAMISKVDEDHMEGDVSYVNSDKLALEFRGHVGAQVVTILYRAEGSLGEFTEIDVRDLGLFFTEDNDGFIYFDLEGLNAFSEGTWEFSVVMDNKGSSVDLSDDPLLVEIDRTLPEMVEVEITNANDVVDLGDENIINESLKLQISGLSSDYENSLNGTREIYFLNDEGLRLSTENPIYDPALGVWNYTFSNQLEDGTYTYTVVQEDLAGNKTEQEITFTVDRTPPHVISSSIELNEGSYGSHEVNEGGQDVYYSSENYINLSGQVETAEEGDVFYVAVNLYAEPYDPNSDENTILLTRNITVNADGTWNIGFSLDNITGVSEGSYYFDVIAYDKAGNASTSKSEVIVIDRKEAEIQADSSFEVYAGDGTGDALDSLTGNAETDRPEQLSSLTLKGKATVKEGANVNFSETNISIEILDNKTGRAIVTQVVAVASDGSWSVFLDDAILALLDGEYTIKVNLEDKYGNLIAEEASDSFWFISQEDFPVFSFDKAEEDTSGNIYLDPTKEEFTLNGSKGFPFSTVEITLTDLNNKAFYGPVTVIVNANGEWSYTFPANENFEDGAVKVVVNTKNHTSEETVIFDSIIEAAELTDIKSADGTESLLTDSGDWVSSDTSIVLQGKASEVLKIQIFDSQGKLIGELNPAFGDWQINLDNFLALVGEDESTSFTIVSTDLLNHSTSETVTIKRNSEVDDVTISLKGDTDLITSVNPPTIQIRASADIKEMTVTIDGQEFRYVKGEEGNTLIHVGNGIFEFTPGALTEGQNLDVSVGIVDAQGNSTMDKPIIVDQIWVNDYVLPPFITMNNSSSDYTNDLTPSFSLTCDERVSDATVLGIYKNGVLIFGAEAFTVTPNGAGQFIVEFKEGYELPGNGTNDGDYTFKVGIEYNNTITEHEYEFELDTQNTILDVEMREGGQDCDHAIVNNSGKLYFSGVAEESSTISLNIKNKAGEIIYTISPLAATSMSNGSWNGAITISNIAGLISGQEYTISITSEDKIGNIITKEGDLSFTYDADPAVIESFSVINPDTGEEFTDEVYYVSEGFPLTGTVKANEKIESIAIYIDGKFVQSTNVGNNGSWSMFIDHENNNAFLGSKTYSFVVTDVAGNSTTIIKTINIDYDTEGPDLSSVEFDLVSISEEDTVTETGEGSDIFFARESSSGAIDCRLIVDNLKEVAKVTLYYKDENGNFVEVETANVKGNSASFTLTDLELPHDGEYTFYISATSPQGNVTGPNDESQAVTIRVDTTDPIISNIILNRRTFEENEEVNLSNLATSTLKVGANGLQIESTTGDKVLFEIIFNGEVIFTSGDYEDSCTATFPLNHVQGTGSYTIRLTDEAGNVTEQEITIDYDSIRPVIDYSDAEFNDMDLSGDSLYYNPWDKKQDTSITLPFASDIAYYIITMGDEVINVEVTNGEFVYESENFVYEGELTIKAVDKYGNVSAEKTINVEQDTTIPSMEFVRDDALYDTGFDTYITSRAEGITFQANDQLRAVLYNGQPLELTGDLSNPTFTIPINQDAEGGLSYTITLIDKAGNVTEKSFTIIYDKTPPVLTVSLSEHDVLDGTLKSPDSLDVYLESNENLLEESIVVKINGKIVDFTIVEQGGGYSIRLSNVNFNDGNYTLEVSAKDFAGNEAKADTSFIVDKTGAEFTIDALSDAILSADEVESGSINLSGTVEEGAEVWISLNGEDWYEATVDGTDWSFSFESNAELKNALAGLKDGTHTITVKGIDSLGNPAEKTIDFGIDKTAPQASIAFEDKDGDIVGGGTPVLNTRDLDLVLTAPEGNDFNGKESFTASILINGNWTTIPLAAKYANDKWTLDLASAEALAGLNGVYTVNVTITDEAGNKTTISQDFEIDLVAPDTINPSDMQYGTDSGNGLANEDIVLTDNKLVTGQNSFYFDNFDLEAGGTLLIYSDSGAQIATIAEVNGKYVLENIESLLKPQNGAYTGSLKFAFKDSLGNISEQSESLDIVYYKELSEPTLKVEDKLIGQGEKLELSGTAVPKSLITITLTLANGVTQELKATTDEYGNWVLPSSNILDKLPSGDYTVTVTSEVVVDGKDTISSTSAPVEVTVDYDAPELSNLVIEDGKNGENGDILIGSSTVTISFDSTELLNEGSLVFTLADGTKLNTSSIKETLVDGKHVYTVEIDKTFAEGEYSLSVSAKDSIGNDSNDLNIDFTVDTTAPSFTIDTLSDAEKILSADEVENGSINLSGTVEAGSKVSISLDGTTWYEADVTDTTWSFDFTKNPALHTALKNLAEGNYSLSVKAVNSLGNEAEVETIDITIDKTAPEASIVFEDKDGDTVGGAGTPVLNTRDLNLELTALEGNDFNGKESFKASISINNTTTTVGMTANYVDGKWLLDLDSAKILADIIKGVHSVNITMTDEAGNESTISQDFEIDLVKPDIIELSDIHYSADSGNVANHQIALTGQNTFYFDGLESGGTVLVYDESGKEVKTITEVNGKYVLEDIESLLSLQNGAYTGSLKFAFKDSLGNISETSETLDIAYYDGKSLPTITIADESVGHGEEIELSGTAIPNSTIIVTLICNGVEQTIETTARANGSWSLLPSKLPNDLLSGSYTATVTSKVEVDGENFVSSTGDSIEFTFDHEAPVLSNLVIMGGEHGVDDSILVDSKTVSISFESNELLNEGSLVFTLGDGTNLTTKPIDKVPVDGKYVYTVEIDKTFAEGDYSLSVSAKDSAGNDSNSLNVDFTVDTTPPKFTIDALSDAEKILSADEVESGSINLSGTVEAGSKVSVSLDGLTWYEASVDGSSWTFNLKGTELHTALKGLGEGNHSLSVKAEDSLGNPSKVQTVDITIDKTAPNASVEFLDAAGDALTGDTPTINTENIRVQLTDLGSNTLNSTDSFTATIRRGSEVITVIPTASYLDGAWTLDFGSVAGLVGQTGDYTLNLTIKDEAGNETAITETFNVDATKPEPVEATDIFYGEGSADVLKGDPIESVDGKLTTSQKSFVFNIESGASLVIYDASGGELTTIPAVNGKCIVADITAYLSDNGVNSSGTLRFEVVDAVGNTSTESSLEILVYKDIPKPTIGIEDDLVNADENIVLSGTALANSLVILTITSGNTSVSFEVMTDDTGNWALANNDENNYELDKLADGKCVVVASSTVTTDGGQVSVTSESEELTFELDTVVDTPDVYYKDGELADDDSCETIVDTVEFTVRGEEGSRVYITLNNILYSKSVILDESGQAMIMLTDIPPGKNNIRISLEDVAGNRSQDKEFVLDYKTADIVENDFRYDLTENGDKVSINYIINLQNGESLYYNDGTTDHEIGAENIQNGKAVFSLEITKSDWNYFRFYTKLGDTKSDTIEHEFLSGEYNPTNIWESSFNTISEVPISHTSAYGVDMSNQDSGDISMDALINRVVENSNKTKTSSDEVVESEKSENLEESESSDTSKNLEESVTPDESIVLDQTLNPEQTAQMENILPESNVLEDENLTETQSAEDYLEGENSAEEYLGEDSQSGNNILDTLDDSKPPTVDNEATSDQSEVDNTKDNAVYVPEVELPAPHQEEGTTL